LNIEVDLLKFDEIHTWSSQICILCFETQWLFVSACVVLEKNATWVKSRWFRAWVNSRWLSAWVKSRWIYRTCVNSHGGYFWKFGVEMSKFFWEKSNFHL